MRSDSELCLPTTSLWIGWPRHAVEVWTSILEEEPKLLEKLTGPRAHMKPAVIVALGTGMRMREHLRMKRHQVDFLRNIVTARDTKNGRPRDIPMNDDVRQALAELCKGKGPEAYVFCQSQAKIMFAGNENCFSQRLPAGPDQRIDLGRICGQHSELDWPKPAVTLSPLLNFSGTQMCA